VGKGGLVMANKVPFNVVEDMTEFVYNNHIIGIKSLTANYDTYALVMAHAGPKQHFFKPGLCGEHKFFDAPLTLDSTLPPDTIEFQMKKGKEVRFKFCRK
jgi:hypothetical protein